MRYFALQHHTEAGWETILAGYTDESDQQLLSAMKLCFTCVRPMRLAVNGLVLALAWVPLDGVVEVVPMRAKIAVKE